MQPCKTFKLIIFLFLVLNGALPASAAAPAIKSQLFSPTTATLSNTLAGFTRARARMKLTSQLTDRLISVNSEIGEVIGDDGVFARLDTTFAELDLEKVTIEQDKLTSRIAYLEKEAQRFRILFQKQSAAETKLDSLVQELAQAGLGLRTLENEERKIREHLARHIITAPAGWLVIDRYAEPGEWVVATSPLAEVGDFRSLVIPFAVNQEEYAWIKSNEQELTLWLPEHKLSVKARVHHLSPAFDPQTRKLNIEMIITSELKRKRGGIRAELNIELPDPSGSLLVPATAVSSSYDSFWLTRPDGAKTPVIVLGRGSQPDTLRVSAEHISPEDRFILIPGSHKTIGE
jgi:membrane fusion protein (multidrug efflux system)